MLAEFTVAQGDTAPELTATLEDEHGNPVDLQGATVRWRMSPIAGGSAKVDANATNAQNGDGSDGSRGQVSYAWQTDDTDTAGLYLGAWHVTFGDGSKLRFPNRGYVLVRVTPAIPVEATPYGYTTVEAVKRTRSLTGTTFADENIATAIYAASDAIDVVCGRTFRPAATQPTDRYYTPATPFLVLIDDAVEVTEVATDPDHDGTFPDVWTAQTDYVLKPFNAATDGRPYTRITLTGHGNLPRWPAGERTVRVKARYGWPAVPYQVTQAAEILTSMLLLRSREAPFGVVTSGIEIGAVARIARDDPQVMFLLRDLIRDLGIAA